MKGLHAFIPALLLLLSLTSCGTSPQIAYPTVQRLASSGEASDFDEATLAQGRRIFTTRCTECHVARPVAQFSAERWRYIVGVMAPRAGLNPADRAAVEAYLVVARDSLPPG